MTLIDAIVAAGMTPPSRIVPDRWMRFPGAGKGRSNRAGWCKLITPTLAIYGDWSSGFSATWIDERHRDDETSRRMLEEARRLSRELAKENRRRQARVAREAERLVNEARPNVHPYLARKGFRNLLGLVHGEHLLIPIRAVEDYSRLLSVQKIAPDGTKRFLTGGRIKGGIHRLGVLHARRIALCEGFATGLTLRAAMDLLPGPFAIIVCFSAGNLVEVAPRYPGALVCADNDESRTGEEAAKRTGLKWVMPPDVETDFNDLHLRAGLISVVEILRRAYA